MSKTFTTNDVASQGKGSALWVIIDEDVYDLTKFQDEHPGGKKILQRVAGKDASKQFWKYHNEGILKKYKAELQIGSLDSKKAAESAAPAKEAPKMAAKVDVQSAQAGAQEPFGELIPFADPAWYHGVSIGDETFVRFCVGRC